MDFDGSDDEKEEEDGDNSEEIEKDAPMSANPSTADAARKSKVERNKELRRLKRVNIVIVWIDELWIVTASTTKKINILVRFIRREKSRVNWSNARFSSRLAGKFSQIFVCSPHLTSISLHIYIPPPLEVCPTLSAKSSCQRRRPRT